MEKEQASLIEQAFADWKEKNMLTPDDKYFAGIFNKQKTFYIALGIGIALNIIVTHHVLLYFSIIFLAVIYINSLCDIWFTSQGIFNEHVIYGKHFISYDKIDYVTKKKNRLIIKHENGEIKIYDMLGIIHEFFKKTFPEKVFYTDNFPIQEATVKLFAFITNASHDNACFTYSIDFLQQKSMANRNRGIISYYLSQPIDPHELMPACNIIKQNKNLAERKTLFEHLFECANIGGPVKGERLAILKNIADNLSLGEEYFNFVEQRYRIINNSFELWEKENIITGDQHKRLDVKTNGSFFVFGTLGILFILMLISIYKNLIIIGIFFFYVILIFSFLWNQLTPCHHLSSKEFSVYKPFSNTHIPLIEIKNISFTNNIIQPYFTIHSTHGERVKIRWNKNSDSNEHRLFLFLKDAFHDKFAIPAYEYTEISKIKLFAAIAGVTNDAKSQAYAIDYLREDQDLYNNTPYVSEHFAYYCQQNHTQLTDTILQVAKEMEYEERKVLFDHLFECAYMSDGVDEKELNILWKIAKYFLIKEWDFKAMQYKYEFHKAEEETEEKKKEERKKRAATSYQAVATAAHRTLGIKGDATLEEIKSAYHELAMKLHPDKLPVNATPKQIEEANENFRVINEAYEFLVDLHAEKVSLKN